MSYPRFEPGPTHLPSEGYNHLTRWAASKLMKARFDEIFVVR